jgi:flagellar protein FlaG
MLIQNLQGVPQAPPPASSSAASAAGTHPSLDVRSAAAAAPARAAPAPAPAEVAAAVTQGNRAMAAMSASLTFEIDAATHSMVVKIVDTTDNSVLRQIPSQEMLDIAQALDKLQGLLLRDQA